MSNKNKYFRIAWSSWRIFWGWWSVPERFYFPDAVTACLLASAKEQPPKKLFSLTKSKLLYFLKISPNTVLCWIVNYNLPRKDWFSCCLMQKQWVWHKYFFLHDLTLIARRMWQESISSLWVLLCAEMKLICILASYSGLDCERSNPIESGFEILTWSHHSITGSFSSFSLLVLC